MSERWIFLVKVKNSPGVLAAMTALFADRGVLIDSLTAHDSNAVHASFGTAILTFAASPAKRAHLARLLERLAAVSEVQSFAYDDAAHARKLALARVALTADALAAALPPSVVCDIVSESNDELLVQLLGPPPVLDAALASLAASGVLLAMDSTVIVV